METHSCVKSTTAKGFPCWIPYQNVPLVSRWYAPCVLTAISPQQSFVTRGSAAPLIMARDRWHHHSDYNWSAFIALHSTIIVFIRTIHRRHSDPAGCQSLLSSLTAVCFTSTSWRVEFLPLARLDRCTRTTTRCVKLTINSPRQNSPRKRLSSMGKKPEERQESRAIAERPTKPTGRPWATVCDLQSSHIDFW